MSACNPYKKKYKDLKILKILLKFYAFNELFIFNK